jgi:hypothetical protein
MENRSKSIQINKFSPTNSTTDVETAAEGDYIARGTLETVQNTIVSTREPTTS